VAWDYYGESGPALKPWLDPGNTGLVTIGGYLPSGVGQASKAGGNRFNLFPNPVSGILHITTGRGDVDMISYRIFDVAGRVRMAGTGFLDGEMVVETAGLGPGLFLVEIAADQDREIHKIVVK
jgi:hypothetical protein